MAQNLYEYNLSPEMDVEVRSAQVEMYHTPMVLFLLASPTHFSTWYLFFASMAAGGFCPYCCLWHNDPPAGLTGAINTPWVRWSALDLG
jgi:hypothetical protein